MLGKRVEIMQIKVGFFFFFLHLNANLSQLLDVHDIKAYINIVQVSIHNNT